MREKGEDNATILGYDVAINGKAVQTSGVPGRRKIERWP